MYGMVNAAIQELVETRFGSDKWAEIKRRAGLELDSFTRMQSYPDSLTYQLVDAASAVLDMPPDEVMKAFGEFWVLYTGRSSYGHLFDIAGDSLRDFLFNLDELHTRVGQNFTELRPPSFRFDDLGYNTYRMHYLTDRTGLCPMVFGLLNGLSALFQTPLSVEHSICQRHGAPHCEFVLIVGESAFA